MIPENEIILASVSSIEGRKIKKYLGLVASETIIGSNIVKDFFTSMRDIVGGRTQSFENVLREAKNTAIEELKYNALDMGANAVLGVKMDVEPIGTNSLMILVSVIGTAVVTE